MTNSIRMSRRGLMIAGAAALATPWLGRGAMAATTLRYGHMHTPNSIAGAQAEWFAEAVAEKSDGGIRIQIFPNSQLGKLQELAEAVSTGAIAFSHNTAGAIGSLYEPFAAFDTPYLYRDVAHLLAVTDADGPVMQPLNEGLIAASGTRVIYGFYFGTRQLTVNRPVLKPADLAGQRIRAIPFPIYMATVEGLGAVPVPVDWSEVPTALATGVVQGQENPLNVILTANLADVQSHLILTGHTSAAQMVMMNDDVWQRLPDAQKEAITQAAAETRARASTEMQESEASDLEALRGRGMTVIDESGDLDLNAFRESVQARIATEFDSRYGEFYAQVAAIS
ncbi:TRAP transporter substrate-binding protein [Paracoccus siganidrum]|uniref:TRAP transporter substrate-binding protein n=1 Tax=Paracoccus siganidrum TaxID=1276757 RepID=A0A418ZZA9_9RHOB|nr:TRAP transporter substrate-binding protein [Paracoccus siganidrum]RJL05916.1 TRAP transporter substrate-binding protein [Paracoccus siganidrum]RMC33012.1 ABC transporter substrate-binding protein [Paracoccus siganidrum]